LIRECPWVQTVIYDGEIVCGISVGVFGRLQQDVVYREMRRARMNHQGLLQQKKKIAQHVHAQ
jgi:hypothetical protein